MIQQLALIGEPETIDDSDSEIDPSSFSENGLIFKSLSEKFKTLNKASEDFSEVLKEAIVNKIWLGFINPSNGKLCSFVYRDADGNINHSLSFKMWLSTGAKAGGLGVTDLNILESLCRGNKQAYSLVVPLILDSKSIREANRIREDNGEIPLLKISRNREIALKKIHQAPAEFMDLNIEYGIPYLFVAKMADVYFESSHQDKIHLLSGVKNLLEKSSTSRDEIHSELADMFGLPFLKNVKLDLADPVSSAQKLIGLAHNDKGVIRDLASELLSLIEEESDPVDEW
jgi:hypothetical protein